MGVLEIHNVTKDFGTARVLNDFSLDVIECTLCCLIGPNGAGKTTTMDVITGRIRPTSGKVVFDGVTISGMDEHAIARLGIGRKFQVPAIFGDLSVRENLQVAHSRHVNPFKNMLRFRDRTTDRLVEKVIEQVGLADRLHAEAGTLSHGEIQWLEIGMILMRTPSCC